MFEIALVGERLNNMLPAETGFPGMRPRGGRREGFPINDGRLANRKAWHSDESRESMIDLP